MSKFLILLALLPAMAMATKPPMQPTQEQRQIQDQAQDQVQAQDQSQELNNVNDLSNDGNSQSVSFTSPDDVTVRNVASANPPSVMGSHSCAIGGSAGVGVPGFNISGGRQRIDPNCEIRETARLMEAFGERELAVIMLCSTDAAKEALGDKACGPSATQEELRRRIAFLLEERERDRQTCNESKDRIADACRK